MSGSVELSTVELHVLVNREDPVEAKRQAELRARISNEAKHYIITHSLSFPFECSYIFSSYLVFI